nr:MAG TPA: hypothetical protein [Caudoviricetes sp.]
MFPQPHLRYLLPSVLHVRQSVNTSISLFVNFYLSVVSENIACYFFLKRKSTHLSYHSLPSRL